jgi:hypothetical protein
MRKLLSVALLMGMILSCNEAKGADWKFWGGSTSAKSEKVLLYYDTESLEHLSGGNIKVWTKAIKQTDIEKAIAKKDKQIIKAAAKQLQKNLQTGICRLISWEIVAMTEMCTWR